MMKRKLLAVWASALVLYASNASAGNWFDRFTSPAAPPSAPPARSTPPARSAPPVNTVRGPARAIDGDTVIVGNTHARLKGVDAAEVSHPAGVEAKRAMQRIVGPTLTCSLTGEHSYGREVGRCSNSSGRDIGAEIISSGKALACPHFDRRYEALEQPDAIARLPRAAYCRQ